MSENEVSQQTKLFENSYGARDYKGVREMVLQNKTSFSTDQFHYNIGTLYAKEGELHFARYHLQKSLKFEGFRPEVFNNLKYVDDSLGIKDDAISVYAFVDLPSSFFMIVTLFLLILAALLLRIRVFKKIQIWILFFTLSSLPYFGSLLSKHFVSGAINIGNGELRAGPSNIFEKNGEVPKGQKLITGNVDKGWCRILYPFRYVGWIEKDSLGFY